MRGDSMTLIEAAKLARGNICSAKLCEINSMSSRHEMIRLMDEAIAALGQAIAEAEQQPEPCVHAKNPKGCYRVRCQLGNKCVDDDMAFRTSPQRGEAEAPKRQAEGAAWQGLTDEDVEEVERWVEYKEEGSGRIPTGKLVRYIEAKLKEKNT